MKNPAERPAPRFPLAIFLGAFLLFQVQPLMGKVILPWFGGGPAVWPACLLFFQLALLAGYAYAHGLGARLAPRAQSALHVVLLAASLLFLPIAPGAGAWKLLPEQEPASRILLLLAASIGVPYLLLASTAPLLQRWFAVTSPGRSPYRLYALSNTGSLLALVSYPFLVEPFLTLRAQTRVWSWSYTAFALAAGWCAVQFGRGGGGAGPQESPDAAAPVRATTALFWLALSACGSTLLLAITNQMCQEVAATPFLWVLPLALYLLTYIICFDRPFRFHRRGLMAAVMVPTACAVQAAGLALPLWVHIAVYSVTLFACCMVCHGELARAKPAPGRLTLYYLMIAAGGALGGILTGVVAPRVFSDYAEFQLGLAACCLLAMAGCIARKNRTGKNACATERAMLSGLGIAFLATLVSLFSAHGSGALAQRRNFYGVLRVSERSDENGPKRVLTHGRVTHGFQYTEGEKRRWPTTYFGPHSGIGLALEHHPRREGRRVGVVGLGAGTIAAYARPGDSFLFYEINPAVTELSERYFTYRKDARGATAVIAGDARVTMERQAAGNDFQNFDVLAVDAFSSDAIPAHLLTAECATLYRQHLQPDGVLALHISNRSLDLAPVARALAARLGWQALRIHSGSVTRNGTSEATWVILTSNRAFLDIPAIRSATSPWSDADPPPLLWTDDFSSLWRVLRY